MGVLATKNIQKEKQLQLETQPWRFRFCKNDDVRFSKEPHLKGHITQCHKLAAKGDITNFEKPSARDGKKVSFAEQQLNDLINPLVRPKKVPLLSNQRHTNQNQTRR